MLIGFHHLTRHRSFRRICMHLLGQAFFKWGSNFSSTNLEIFPLFSFLSACRVQRLKERVTRSWPPSSRGLPRYGESSNSDFINFRMQESLNLYKNLFNADMLRGSNHRESILLLPKGVEVVGILEAVTDEGLVLWCHGCYVRVSTISSIPERVAQLVGERAAVLRVNDKLYVRRIKSDTSTSEATSGKIREIEGARYSHRCKVVKDRVPLQVVVCAA